MGLWDKDMNRQHLSGGLKAAKTPLPKPLDKL
jgi:hypothetical protein